MWPSVPRLVSRLVAHSAMKLYWRCRWGSSISDWFRCESCSVSPQVSSPILVFSGFWGLLWTGVSGPVSFFNTHVIKILSNEYSILQILLTFLAEWFQIMNFSLKWQILLTIILSRLNVPLRFPPSLLASRMCSSIISVRVSVRLLALSFFFIESSCSPSPRED